MNIKKSLKNIFNSVAGNLAVIGPYDDNLTAEALLAGIKPLGWLSIEPLTVYEDPKKQAGYAQQWRGQIQRLDEAVKQGKLKSLDVVVHRGRIDFYDLDSGFREYPPYVMRHYCQPDKETDMKLLAAYNQKAFNFEETDDSVLKKDIGTYLGYRDKDVKLWQHGRWPEKLLSHMLTRHAYSERNQKRIVSVLQKVAEKWFYLSQLPAHKAYQGKLLHQIEKEQKKAARNQPKP